MENGRQELLKAGRDRRVNLFPPSAALAGSKVHSMMQGLLKDACSRRLPG
jgi:hypothetical protein